MALRIIFRPLVFLLALALPATLQAACQSPSGAAAVTGDFGEWVNRTRREKGLRQLSLSETLTMAATEHACHMAQLDRLTHSGRGGRGLKSRLNSKGYRLSVAVENTALSSRPLSSEVPELLWANSAKHRVNLLHPSITQMGFGVVSANGKSYYVFIGAAPR